MYKKLIIIFVVFLLTGCWNYQELNTLAITTAMSIDKKDDNYEVSILIANSKKGQSSSQESESQTVLYSGVGKTVSAALKEIDLVNPRQTYIGHISIVIVSEEVAKEGLINILDFLLRNSESTKRFQLAIARDTKAKNVLKVVTPLETFASQNVSDNIRVSHESQAKSSSMLYSKFIYLLMEKGIHPILPSVTVKGDVKDGSKEESLQQTTPDANIKLQTIGLFRDDKLIGYADNDQSKGINIIRDEVDQMNIYLKCDNNYTVIKILNLTSKLGIKNISNLDFKIDIDTEATIIEDNCKHNLLDEDVIEEIRKEAASNIKKLAQKGLKFAKEKKVDVFGFGNLLYKNSPKEFNKYDNWDKDGFTNSNITINSKVDLKFKGSGKQNLKEAINEN